MLSLHDIALDDVERKLASFDIPTQDNIHRYQCNDPILFNIFMVKCLRFDLIALSLPLLQVEHHL